MTLTQLKNVAFGIVSLVVAVTSETGFMNLVPDRYKHYIAAAAFIAMWIKGHWNLFINPNGTPAQVAYDGKAVSQ